MNRKTTALSPLQKERIIRDMWITHDSRWFIKTVMDQGFEKATEMNINVIQSFAKFEIKSTLP